MKKFRYIKDGGVYDDDMVDIIAGEELTDDYLEEAVLEIYSYTDIINMCPYDARSKILEKAISIYRKDWFVEELEESEDE
jgi:hypothetical protein